MEAKHRTDSNLSAGAGDRWGLGGKAGVGCTWFESPTPLLTSCLMFLTSGSLGFHTCEMGRRVLTARRPVGGGRSRDMAGTL